MAQDAVKTTTKAPSVGGQHHQSSQQSQRRIPITTPKPRPQSPDSQHSSLDENNSRARESETTATIRVEKNPNFTPTQSVPPNEYTTISAGKCSSTVPLWKK